MDELHRRIEAACPNADVEAIIISMKLREAGTMADRRLKPASPPAFFLSETTQALTPAVTFPIPRKDPELRGLIIRWICADRPRPSFSRVRGGAGGAEGGAPAGSVGGRLVSSASGASPGGHLSR